MQKSIVVLNVHLSINIKPISKIEKKVKWMEENNRSQIILENTYLKNIITNVNYVGEAKLILQQIEFYFKCIT